jgi:predicted dehydrogenase
LDEVSGDMVAKSLPSPRLERDVRRVLEDRHVDAVVIAAPDHWHAPAAIMALAASKHVYLEKPSSHNPREDELLVAAQQKYGKVVQMGNQQRSAPESIELITRISEGEIGDIYQAKTWYANNRGSIGNGTIVPAPNWLDWELWQGPAPRRPYQDNLHPYNWHWFWHWGTGETCNNAAHELDIARWAMGLGDPVRVTAEGARRFHTDDDWEMYDTLDLNLHYAGGRSISWSGQSCSNAPTFGRTRGTQLLGTKGWAIVDRAGYEIYDLAGQFVDGRKRIETSASNSADLVGADELTDLHIANFIDTVRGTAGRQASPIEEGAISTRMCHLGNIAYRTDGAISIDPGTGRPTSSNALALWGREYHEGWAPEGA